MRLGEQGAVRCRRADQGRRTAAIEWPVAAAAHQTGARGLLCLQHHAAADRGLLRSGSLRRRCQLGCCHDCTVTGGGKASVELEQFRCVNTLISIIKKALSDTYHSVKFAKHAHRDLAEGQFCFNCWYDLRVILGCLVGAMVAAPTSPGRGTRVAEHRRHSSRFLVGDGEKRQRERQGPSGARWTAQEPDGAARTKQRGRPVQAPCNKRCR